MADTGYLMSATFPSRAAPPAPPTYTTRVAAHGEVIVASIVDDTGDVAASGRLAVAGSAGVIDQVETAVGHRRRGLGTVIMNLLSHHAAGLGLHRGVLVATDSGRDLYRTLGWKSCSPIAAAFLPETERHSA